MRQIREGLGVDVPIVQTVFSPLSQAKSLAGQDVLIAHIRTNPEAVKAGLRVIQETTIAFVKEVMSQRVDGIFYAVQHAQAHLLNPIEYRRFGRAHDLAILKSASGGWLNVLHLHGKNIYFDQFGDYPVHIVNWHDRETPPTLSEGLEKISGAVCGGIRQTETMVLGTPEAVKAEVAEAIEQTCGRRLIVGTGCVTPITAPVGNLRAARQSVEW